MKTLARFLVPLLLLFGISAWFARSQFQPKPNPFGGGQPFNPYGPFSPYGPFGVQPGIQSKHKLTLKKGDRIVFMGDNFAERAARFGYFETLFQARFPEL